MAEPRQHPVERLLVLAQENAALLWRAYDLHLTVERRDADWHRRSIQLFGQAMAADARVWRIRDLHLRSLGPAPEDPSEAAT
jgi:hypothetical protein